ncbi:MAG: hypothetical protein GXP43_02210 [bacterium]|nr:hypothetical protein [bacterium]
MRLIFFVLFLSVFFFGLSQKAAALTLESASYKLQMGNFNTSAGQSQSTSFSLDQTTGQLSPGKYTGTNYIVKAGFQYIHSLIPFAFSLSKTSIDFGVLSAATAKTDSLVLTISNSSAYGYQVLVKENHPLRNSQTNDEIPDTSCDAATTCSEYDANVWSSSTAYGFGYNMAGDDVDTTDFVDSTYYRPFPSLESSEAGAVAMSSANAGTNRQATMTVKVNVSGTQAAGRYNNELIFIAVPSI